MENRQTNNKREAITNYCDHIGGCYECPFSGTEFENKFCGCYTEYNAPDSVIDEWYEELIGKHIIEDEPTLVDPSEIIDNTDNVNHPSHYEPGKVECIEAMIETQGVVAVQSFCVCNAFKYLWRHNNKNQLEDIKKAIWYLNKFVELEERGNNDEQLL